MRTLPSISEGAAPAANTSSAGAGAPGACSVLSNSAMATAGANSVAMATFVADCLARFRADAPLRSGAFFVARFDLGEADAPEVVVMVCKFELRCGHHYTRALLCARRGAGSYAQCSPESHVTEWVVDDGAQGQARLGRSASDLTTVTPTSKPVVRRLSLSAAGCAILRS